MKKVLDLVFKPADWLLLWPDKDNHFLKGLYAPVEKELCEECEVVGVLPEAVYGEFARNGPNARFAPAAGYHFFDGDGMVHGVRIKEGKATYSNRFVKTAKLAAEEDAGKPLAIKLGDMASWLTIPRLILYSLKTKLGAIPDFDAELESTANTSLQYHAGRLLALGEGGLPYALRVMCDGVMETIGKASFEGEMKTPFTAHPKRDPSTGKLYGFGYQLGDKNKPFLTFYVLDESGKLERQFPVDVARKTMMHDFSITENYAIFLDLPLLLKPELMLTGKIPIAFDKKQGSRMGVLPLNATDSSDLRWFDMPETFAAFHVLNSWEEKVEVEGREGEAAAFNSVVKVVTCDFFDINMNFQEVPENFPIDQWPQPHTTTLNLDTGKASRARILPSPPTEAMDFPQLRRSLVGRKNRFGYVTGFDGKGFPTSVIKLDLQAATPETAQVGRIDLGEFVGGECLFIPSKPDNGGESEEDDGFLATFVSPKDGGNSELRVWNAKTMSAEPIATVKLPARVPMGFHALFLTEADLAVQQPHE